MADENKTNMKNNVENKEIVVKTEQETQENKEIIKADQVKTATHVDILNLGNFLFEQATSKQREHFEKRLLEHEENVIERSRQQFEIEMKKLEEQHSKSIKKLQRQAKEMQDRALQDEAVRVREIMDKVAAELVVGAVLEGQQKLDTALKKARSDFDVEKNSAVQKTIKEQQVITEGLLKNKVLEHEKKIEQLNKGWDKKIGELSVEHSVTLKEMLAQQTYELRKQFDIELTNALHEAQLKHDLEISLLKENIAKLEQEKIDLQTQITTHENTIKEQKSTINNVMKSFKGFVELSQGFQEGQSDFLLTELVPDNLEGFLTGIK